MKEIYFFDYGENQSIKKHNGKHTIASNDLPLIKKCTPIERTQMRGQNIIAYFKFNNRNGKTDFSSINWGILNFTYNIYHIMIIQTKICELSIENLIDVDFFKKPLFKTNIILSFSEHLISTEK